MATTCRYAVPHGAGPLQAVIEMALAQVVVKLAALQVGIVGEETGTPWFVHIPAIDLRDHVEWKTADNDGHLLRIIETQNSQPWPDVQRRPPWKLIIAINSAHNDWVDIVFAAHHVLGDGKSSLLFHTHLLRAFSHPSDVGSVLRNHILTIDELPALVPAQEDLVKFNTSWPFFLGELWHEFSPAWLRRDPPVWTGKPIDFDVLDMHLRLVVIPASAVQALLATCRTHGTTLTPLLHILVLVSLARRLPASTAPSFTALTPISLRPFVSLPPDSPHEIATAMANLVTLQTYPFSAGVVADLRRDRSQDDRESHIWDLAAALRSALRSRLDDIPNDDIMGILGWVSSWHAWWLKHRGKPRQASWRVSNLGSICGESQPAGSNGWAIQRAIYAQSTLVAGPAFSVNVAGVEHGDISVSLSWQESIVDTELMDGLAEDLRACFGRFGETGRFGILNVSSETAQ